MQIEENVPLAQFTTLKIGGLAQYFVRATSESGLLNIVRFARERDLPMFLLGGGSNLVVSDAGFPGLVVQMAIEGQVLSELSTRVIFRVPAGTDWNEFVKLTCQSGYTGVECMAGIPGTVGGSPIQNIGAYGQEVSQTIHSVRALDRETHEFVILSARECGFGYRRSIFNTKHRGRYIVTSVVFEFGLDAQPRLTYPELQKHFAGNPDPKPMEIYEAVRTIRAGKGMLTDAENAGPDSRSAGSFFKNPLVSARKLKEIVETIASGEDVPHWPADGDRVKLAAAWLIEQAGFKKGFALGKVGISSKHTLALINRTGDASCADLLRLRDLIVLTVEQRFGVTLEQEPVMLG